MNWINAKTDTMSFEKDFPQKVHSNHLYNNLSHEDQLKTSIQLKKFQDPSQDSNRQTVLTLVTKFGDLVVNNRIKEIATNLLSRDCEIYLFCSTGRAPVRWGHKQEGFISLYHDMEIQERIPKQTFVDTVKSTAIQICTCKVLYKEDNVLEDVVTFESFTLNDGIIRKYMASFAKVVPAVGSRDPLEPTRKDIMLAKVKTINYALVNKPDLEKVASLLHENTEYKIWGWGSKKCTVLNKHNFMEEFRNLEESYVVKCIVPYEVYTDREFVVGNYVYYLEGKASFHGRKFVWFSSSVYVFDEDTNIAKISQQGELFSEEQAPPVPFEVYPREVLIQKIQIMSRQEKNFQVFFNADVNFRLEVCLFAPSYYPFNGPNNKEKENCHVKQEKKPFDKMFDWEKDVDNYTDDNDPSYETVFSFRCQQGITDHAEFGAGKLINTISFAIGRFEKGKLSKVILSYNDIPEPIPSPFDDQDFNAINIIKKVDWN